LFFFARSFDQTRPSTTCARLSGRAACDEDGFGCGGRRATLAPNRPDPTREAVFLL
jgi:hypothetical protein